MDDSLASKVRAANAILLVDGDAEAIGRFFSPDYVAHTTGGGARRGHDSIRAFLDLLRNAFPDLEVVVEILLEGEGRIAWQRTLRGTQRGALLGFPATGRRVVWRDLAVSRFHDGLIAEDWLVTDLAEQLLRARKA